MEELFSDDFFTGLDRLSLVVNRDVRGRFTANDEASSTAAALSLPTTGITRPETTSDMSTGTSTPASKLLIKLFKRSRISRFIS